MEERNSVTIHESEQIGEVKIADEVVAIIASLAASEIEGIRGIGINPVKKNKRNLSKGVKIDIADNEVICDIELTLLSGVKIPEIARAVQSKIKAAIETMTGLAVKEVNVHISAIYFE